MAVPEIIADQIRLHSIDLVRLEAGLTKKVTKILKSLEGDLAAELARVDPAHARRTVREARLLKLLQATKDTIRKGVSEAREVVHTELSELADFEVNRAISLINGAVGVDLIASTISPAQLRALASETLIFGASSGEWWRRQEAALQNKFKDEMRTGVLRGENLNDLVRRVRGRREHSFTDGIMSTSTRNAAALVRSSVQTIANAARLDTYQRNSRFLKGVQWTSTLDGRTTPICIGLDGLVWDMDNKPVDHSQVFPGPTAHWGCRSTQVPVLKSIEDLGGKATSKIPPGTRASMDGQVPARVGYEDWLRSKGDTFAKQVLGPAKFDMWKDGKLTLRELISEHNRPLTVAELRARK